MLTNGYLKKSNNYMAYLPYTSFALSPLALSLLNSLKAEILNKTRTWNLN